MLTSLNVHLCRDVSIKGIKRKIQTAGLIWESLWNTLNFIRVLAQLELVLLITLLMIYMIYDLVIKLTSHAIIAIPIHIEAIVSAAA
jgi:hypothetical protein